MKGYSLEILLGGTSGVITWYVGIHSDIVPLMPNYFILRNLGRDSQIRWMDMVSGDHCRSPCTEDSDSHMRSFVGHTL